MTAVVHNADQMVIPVPLERRSLGEGGGLLPPVPYSPLTKGSLSDHVKSTGKRHCVIHIGPAAQGKSEVLRASHPHVLLRLCGSARRVSAQRPHAVC
ncbi:hypothetical protein DPEC_G00349060 [Dallia pectoralis]|uniref:Uncharacterized protein n=1 Tax=Dallia pectoralis TaxID=75939 RepID=A0ACC2F186_DALPE|nr:hypothetical protein DPEC_G00349060 [Dallia pectoralis]